MRKRFSLKIWDEVEDSERLSQREIELDLPVTGTNDQMVGEMISQKMTEICHLYEINRSWPSEWFQVKVTHVRRQSSYYVIQEDLGGGRLSVIIAYDCTE